MVKTTIQAPIRKPVKKQDLVDFPPDKKGFMGMLKKSKKVKGKVSKVKKKKKKY